MYLELVVSNTTQVLSASVADHQDQGCLADKAQFLAGRKL